MDEGVTAVRRQFPARIRAIDDLSSRSEDFREICRDFADAQSELEKWNVSTDPKRNERVVEYRELIAELSKEIEGALDASVPPTAR
ncbi:hypothetical protein [Rhizobium leguminosarum]|jgi:hypothetical protein|uniref:Uncharacterized protein n=1 Tax=Rhizobium leguminosarum TaxID=384 RepID=A0A4Q8Y3Y0_RHILE|nr:hypothetical protein [Rhizobium leguminosarum]TAU84161.1 hypothetical protein ELI40_13310 [Rhizobium leguminosarum]TAU89329.1 hypothetical protein ELI41_12695 [Rhizobium leguminosarum]TAV49265.1 hypothetical protein ELI32_14270 [Rhizobium leguminosarum]TAV53980.1 hypothetical protein ELI29_13390 [Rhizobium leguminosarum]TAV58629.1 hypothetical protein ELI31_12790 [Rhizobium leguminosarum]